MDADTKEAHGRVTLDLLKHISDGWPGDDNDIIRAQARNRRSDQRATVPLVKRGLLASFRLHEVAVDDRRSGPLRRRVDVTQWVVFR